MSESAGRKADRRRNEPDLLAKYIEQILSTPDFFEAVPRARGLDLASLTAQELNKLKAEYTAADGARATWGRRARLVTQHPAVAPQPTVDTGFRFGGTPFDANRSPAPPEAGPPLAEIDWVAVRRGTAAHFETLVLLSHAIESRPGAVGPFLPGAGEPNYDLAWWFGQTPWIAEVKSLPVGASSESIRLRLGLGQVLDYRCRMWEADASCRAALIVERCPSERRWVAVCADVGVILAWPPTFDGLA